MPWSFNTGREKVKVGNVGMLLISWRMSWGWEIKSGGKGAAGTTGPSAHSPLRYSCWFRRHPLPPAPDKPDCFTGSITISDVQELEVWIYLQPELGGSRLPEKNHFNQENIISDLNESNWVFFFSRNVTYRPCIWGPLCWVLTSQVGSIAWLTSLALWWGDERNQKKHSEEDTG